MQAQEPYRVTIDLTQVQNDQVPVSIEVPPVDTTVVEYHMARVVPGTYSISDFGRFVTNFQALDSAGNALTVAPVGASRNIYRISDATRLHTISYWVHDTFDRFQGYTNNIVFEPGGTSIEEDRKVFVLNTFGLVGYLDGMKFSPYTVTIHHDPEIYGATSLKRDTATVDTDVFVAENFNFLADAPIMYSRPDTVSRNIAGADILVSVYSPNDKLKAAEVMDNIYDLMEAQAKYLGGKLPVDRYAYLIYLMDYNSYSGSMGALEHSYSSLYTLPEGKADQLAQTVRDVAAHEFFHIVTPLNIHSEEIHDFNYIDPKMSEHLWLYEGVTEYSSMHVQVKYGLYDEEKFLSEIRQKILVANRFPKEVSFTEMSEKILEPKFERMYSNVYYKGALIGMCLDLHLLKYSNGTKDLQWLMQALAKEYGMEKPFQDEELFATIERLTYPEVGEFLRTYVAGTAELPLTEALAWVGVEYEEERVRSQISLGRISLDVNDNQELYISSTAGMNDFGKEMGYQTGDIILSLNGKELNINNIDEVMDNFALRSKPGEEVRMVVRRLVDGEEIAVVLSGKAVAVEVSEPHFVGFAEKPSPAQLKLREAWLKPKGNN